jgi:hypothetical protein
VEKIVGEVAGNLTQVNISAAFTLPAFAAEFTPQGCLAVTAVLLFLWHERESNDKTRFYTVSAKKKAPLRDACFEVWSGRQDLIGPAHRMRPVAGSGSVQKKSAPTGRFF